ncbi:MAG TPA: response regulator [Caulobacteraceae bacterium]|nr:response regulator [Caulobacteraceae bacterium]
MRCRAAASREKRHKVMLTGRRILVVEDDPGTAEALCNEILSRQGQPFGPVSDIWEALEWLARERIDAAMVDFDLRAGDAAALAHALAGGGKGVLVYTSRDLAERMFADVHRIAVWRKPINAAAAVTRLAELLGPTGRPAKARGRR